MVVVNEPTVVDFVVVIEATANMVAHWETIKKNYIRPAVEYFNGRQPSAMDYVGNNGSSQFAYVLFHAADCGSQLVASCSSVTQSPWDFVHSLDALTLSGGGCERYSLVAEGLGRAVQLFDDLAQRRGQGNVMKVCFLVCNSPPYELPCFETYIYAGQTAEKLAQLMASRGINLSVISPQHIPQLKQIYLSANQNKSPKMNYAQDPRHLVFISGFTLPTEREPMKVDLNEEQKSAKQSALANNVNSVTATSSTPSPAQHLSPLSTFRHNSTIAVHSPGTLQQPVSSTVQNLPGQLDSNGGISTQNMNGNITATTMSAQVSQTTSQVNIANMPSSVALPNFQQPQHNQQQSVLPSYSSGANMSQPSTGSPFSRAALTQSLTPGMTSSVSNIGSGIKPGATNMLQGRLTQAQSSELQISCSDTGTFPGQPGNSISNNMGGNNSVGNMSVTSMPGIPNQSMFNPQSNLQQNAMQDQHRMTPQSMASRMVDSSTMGMGSPNMQQVPPYSTAVLSTNLQSNQPQAVSVANSGNMNAFTGSPGNSNQQMTVNTSPQQMNRVNPRPNVSQNINSMLRTTTGNVGIMATTSQQLNNQMSNNSMQMNQTITQQTQGSMPGNSMNIALQQSSNPHVHNLANNDQMQITATTSSYQAANNVAMTIITEARQTASTVQQQQNNYRQVWNGILEWKEKRKLAQGNQERTVHSLTCVILLRANQSDDTINVATWPKKLMMQLIPQIVFSSMKSLMKNNNVSVSLRLSPNDQMLQLVQIMQTKWMGVVQIPSTNPQISETKVMLVIYSQKSSAFFGVFPHDPANFISTIRQVITRHQTTPRPNVDISTMGQFQQDRIQGQQNMSGQSQFMMQQPNNPRPNLNPALKPQNPLQQQQSRVVAANPNMQVRSNIQMQSGMNNQMQRTMDMNFNQTVQQRMQGGNQMGNQAMMMSQQQIQQNNMGQQMQQTGGNQQFSNMYQSNMNHRPIVASRPVMNQNADMMRQQQLQRMRLQQTQHQMNRQMNQMPSSHNVGDEQLRTLLQQSGNNMSQNMNQQRPRLPINQGMRQMSQGTMRAGYMQNQQMRHPIQGNHIIGMQQQQQQQQQRFGMQ